ncbi:MAG: twin-arginine translocation signal domain-containing protein, partial [Verrucomicrobiota bacterium]
MNRRQFLTTSSLAAAALATPGCASQSTASRGRIPGANDTIRVAVVGFNGRGKDHISGFKKLPNVRLVALCDCDR